MGTVRLWIFGRLRSPSVDSHLRELPVAVCFTQWRLLADQLTQFDGIKLTVNVPVRSIEESVSSALVHVLSINEEH
jgi:hypothetical protein